MLIISSPSGAGKTTLTKALIKADPNTKLSISVTTRSPRGNEVDGKDYHFITEKKYNELKKAKMLLESAEVFGYHYGTPKKDTEDTISKGRDMVYDIDWQGAVQLMQNCRKDVVSIFIMPPSVEILEQRLRNRATDDESTIERRLAGSKIEMSKSHYYDYILTNYEIEDALKQIQEILNKERQKRL